MSGNIEQALDLGQGVYRQSETNALLDVKTDNTNSLSKVASSVLLSGNLALASSAVTKSNANITYTGNGTTQSITTGIASVDFTVASNGSGYYHDRAAGDCIVKNDAGTIIESGSAVVNVSKVHIKARSAAADNTIFDGVRGVNNTITTNQTIAEANVASMSAFTTTGFALNTANITWNASGVTYTAHQTLYTHIKWGLTNQGKRYLTAYNPVTREVMTMYQGSGIAGHQIPNALGIKLDYRVVKSLDSGTKSWYVKTVFSNNGGALNSTTAFTYGSDFNDYNSYMDIVNISDSGSWVNTANETYISYGFANSETKIITQYQGTGASGNFVETKDVNGVARKPRRVIIKRTDSTGYWVVIDSKRGDYEVYFNVSDVEASFDRIDISYNGVTLKNDNANGNASGGQYIAIVEFDTTNSNDDTYFDLPTDDTNLNVTAGKLPYTDGRDTTNGAYNVFTQSYTGSVDFSTCPDGIHYVALDSNNAPKFYKGVAIGSYEKESADDNRLVFNTDDGKWYTTTGGELITNGTFDSDVSGWTTYNSTLVWSSGQGLYTDNGTGDNIGQLLTFEVGEVYVLEQGFEASLVTLEDGDTTGLSFDYASRIAETSVNTYILIPSSPNMTLKIQVQGAVSSPIDNISVYKANATLDTALTTPISFIDDKPYQVASGTPMDRLEDYPSIPKNVMESSYVDGDLEVSGEVKGKNACTAWVNFDGTTIPPTIRDSYNVSQVIKTGTAYYDVYFENPMDNINFSITGTAGNTGYNYGAYLVDATPDNKPRSINKFSIWTGAYGALQATTHTQVQVFGGKN